MKRTISTLLVICLLISALPLSAVAETTGVTGKTYTENDLYYKFPNYLNNSLAERYIQLALSTGEDILNAQSKYDFLRALFATAFTDGIDEEYLIQEAIGKVTNSKFSLTHEDEYCRDMAQSILSKMTENNSVVEKAEEVTSFYKKAYSSLKLMNDYQQMYDEIEIANALKSLKSGVKDETIEWIIDQISPEGIAKNWNKFPDAMTSIKDVFDTWETALLIMEMYELDINLVSTTIEAVGTDSYLGRGLQLLKWEKDNQIVYIGATFLSEYGIKQLAKMVKETVGIKDIMSTPSMFVVSLKFLNFFIKNIYEGPTLTGLTKSYMRLSSFYKLDVLYMENLTSMIRRGYATNSEKNKHTLLFNLRIAAVKEFVSSTTKLTTATMRSLKESAQYTLDNFILTYNLYIENCLRELNGNSAQCLHEEWMTTGVCSKCKIWAPTYNIGCSDTLGIYKVGNGNAVFYWRPYSSSNRVTIDNGSKMELIGAVENYFGEQWYCYIYNNTTYYSRNLMTYVCPSNNSVTVTPLTIPKNGTLYQGTGFYTNGGISVSNCSLVSAKAYFLDSNNKKNGETPEISISGKSYILKNSKVDANLYFSRLKPGSWRYEVVFTTDSEDENYKTITITSKEFLVISKPTVAKPTIEAAGYVAEGRRYTIKNTGDTLYYSYDGSKGAMLSTKAASVSVVATSTSQIRAYSIKNGVASKTAVAEVTVPQLKTPNISSVQGSDGVTVTISADAGATVYYSIDNSGKLAYTKPIVITQDCTIKSFSERNGYITSATSIENITIEPPRIPDVNCGVSKDIAVGDPITAYWANDPLASYYTVSVKYNGELDNTKSSRVNSPVFSFIPEKAGEYSITVTATNIAGETDNSNEIVVTTHGDLTVAFKDYNDTIISEQKVRYGYDAASEEVPIPYRRGYTFKGWKGNTNEITSDTTVIANYQVNIYVVKFYNTNGDYITSQSIEFDNPADIDRVKPSVTIKNGYVFQGWTVTKAADDSARDIEHIDSDMSLMAVQGWKNKSLPAVVTNLKAVRNFNANKDESTGYDVTFDLSSIPDDETKAKIIVSLLSADNKLLGVTVVTVDSIADAQNVGKNVFVSCNSTALADRVEVSIMGIDGNDRTGGVIAETVSCKPSFAETSTSVWSEWLDSLPSGVTTATQSKTVYRYRNNTKNVVVTSSSTAPSGYKLEKTNSYWGDWSAWQDTPVTAVSGSREVKTRTVTVTEAYNEYRYGRWANKWGTYFNCCPSGLTSPHEDYTSWSKTRTNYVGDGINSGYCTCGYPVTDCGHSSEHKGNTYMRNNRVTWHRYEINGANYYWEETRVIPAVTKAQYQYRDKKYEYTYYKWDKGTWSDWTDTVYTSNSDGSRDAESKTVYRYIVDDPGITPVESSSETRLICGSLSDIDANLKGKKATLLVYKVTNSDPTESQLEYVGQTSLGDNNSYSYSFQCKEEPTISTGDYIVAIAVEGCDGLINIDRIEAPKPEYTVTFCEADGTKISDQTVAAGEHASAPAAAELEGYTFVCWNRDIATVRSNMTVMPIYVLNKYAVVFVDFLNETVQLEKYSVGEAISAPTVDSCDGYTFRGWKCVEPAEVIGDPGIVMDDATTYVTNTEGMAVAAVYSDLVVVADWAPSTFTVVFTNEDGEAISEQTVDYGKSAEPPVYSPNSSESVFAGWSTTHKWWQVKENMTVFPVVLLKDTASAPAFTVDDELGEVKISADNDAQIYYTLDGSDPSMYLDDEQNDLDLGQTFLYDGPIEVLEGDTVRAIAVVDGKNDSEIVEINFYFSDANPDEDEVELGTWDVNAVAGNDINLSFLVDDNTTALAGYMFHIYADPAIFSIPYGENASTEAIVLGDLCHDNGGMIVDAYTEEDGWTVLWVGSEATNGSGQLLSATLKVNNDVPSGNYPIKVTYSKANTVTADEIEAGTEAISVKCTSETSTVLGDVNGDGIITVYDVVLIARHIIGTCTLQDDALLAADVNQDGMITNGDAIKLLRYIVGLEVLGDGS